MHRTLIWHEVGIERNLRALRDGIAARRARLPPENAREFRMMGHWLSSIERILGKIAAIRESVRAGIEADLGYQIASEEMLLLAFFQPSTRNLVSEILVHFGDDGCILSGKELAEMARLPEAAEALAWIGDAALKIGVLPEIWSPRVVDAGTLSERRKAYESNANMARLCDRWGLYEHRIHLDPPVPKGDVGHVKGTLVEAVLGIVFLQCGLKGVARAARLLRP
ncbi:ribonuclease III domain-containing protein [Methanofollis sp. UBA420]|jgi:ribonuclease-3|uniref:ribonuclease III domain-containing protein n=1 Tax=Methanofollis sp. UBA420 TaxID=1915514 RepID=UPI00316ABF48